MRRPLPPLWLAEPSRFAALPLGAARLSLGLAVLLLMASFSALWLPVGGTAGDGPGDVVLYGAIVDGVRHGGNYYAVTADALRAGDYPLRPFVTFRLPTLAVIEAHLPDWLVAGVLGALATGVLIAWFGRLSAALRRPALRIALPLLIAGGLIAQVQPALATFHEVWAGLLIALSLALRRPGRWIEPVALGLAAMLIRETSALYVLVMAALAITDGERREAVGWLGALAVLAAVVAVHAHAVAQVVRPLDALSPGWAGMLGVGFFVRTMAASTVLSLLPILVSAPLVALALIGWAGWRSPTGLRVTATLAAYATLLALFARADTFYWGLLVAPLILPGLALAPDAVRDLVAGALDSRRITVRRVVR
jgi:hypothetical protein